MSKSQKEKRFHNGLQIDSDEEFLTLLWLEELQERRYIQKIERANSFLLSLPIVNTYYQEVAMKTKVKTVTKTQTILEGHIYTPEFKVVWTKKAIDSIVQELIPQDIKLTSPLYCQEIEISNSDAGRECASYIEAKPEWDVNGMTRQFKINQKWIWQKHNIYINLIQPQSLCEKTFTPEAWKTTPSGKKRAIHWDIVDIDTYLEKLGLGV